MRFWDLEKEGVVEAVEFLMGGEFGLEDRCLGGVVDHFKGEGPPADYVDFGEASSADAEGGCGLVLGWHGGGSGIGF